MIIGNEKARTISINSKIIVLIVIMVLSCSTFIGIFSYVVYRSDSLAYKTETALSIANTVAITIDGNQFAETAKLNEKTDYYYQLEPVIEEIWKASDLLYLYAMVEHEDGISYRYIFSIVEDSFGYLDPIEGYGADVTFATGESRAIQTDTEDYGSLLSTFAAIRDSNNNIVGIVGADLPIDEVMNEISGFGIKVGIVVVAFNILFVFLARAYLNHFLGRPIKALTEFGMHIAEGNFDMNVKITNKDEIGLLANSFSRVGSTLSNLIYEMENMASKQSSGDYEAFMEPSVYKGSYYTVASSINKMVGEYVSDFQHMITVFSAIGDGDLEVQLRQFPGKKEVINTSINALRTNLKALSHETGMLVASAANGDLSKKIEAGKYKGEWGNLTQQLNSLLNIIIEPIQEAALVLDKMSVGDFSVRIQGNYKGDFEIIKKSLNSTQDAISSYISEINQVLLQLSSRNLDVFIGRTYIGEFDTIKDSINTIIKTFNSVLIDINDSADLVASSSRQVSELSSQLSLSATNQENSIGELDASIGQVASDAEKNFEVATNVTTLVTDVKNNASKGVDMMSSMLSTMDGINKASNNILQFIDVINNIASQTNILALNASIEAARVGVQGRGFAVVAEEVGSLALRTRDAAMETNSLIEASIEKISEGINVANDTSQELNVIASQITEVSQYIDTIADASKAQNSNISRINQEMTQISQSSQSNTEISKQCTATSEELFSQSELFRVTVSKFNLTRKG